MAKSVASEDHISMNQFIASAVAEKISALTTGKYLGEHAKVRGQTPSTPLRP
jgi:hypothetical protein